MATIQFTKYRFDIPKLISSDDYETLMEILTERPEYKLNPPSSFVEAFKGELIFFGIGLVGLLIVSLNLAEWSYWVGVIPAFLAFFSLFSFIPSMFSYLGFISDKSIYYDILKRDIIKSNSYKEFTNLRNKR